MMLSRALGVCTTLVTAALFGFFYAWTLTMSGLDSAEPESAIAAMVAVNASIRNPVFFVVFAGAPLTMLAAALSALTARQPARATWFFGAFAMVLVAVLVTATGNVPLNESLAEVDVSAHDAQSWRAYSAPWQGWNVVRTVTCGISVLLCGLALSSRRAS